MWVWSSFRALPGFQDVTLGLLEVKLKIGRLLLDVFLVRRNQGLIIPPQRDAFTQRVIYSENLMKHRGGAAKIRTL